MANEPRPELRVELIGDQPLNIDSALESACRAFDKAVALWRRHYPVSINRAYKAYYTQRTMMVRALRRARTPESVVDQWVRDLNTAREEATQ